MKTIIFDLDGTLIDSIYDIALSMNEVLRKLNYPLHEIKQYNYFLGDGAYILVKNAMPKNATQEEIQKALENFIKVYESDIQNNTKAYEGIYTMLSKLEELNIKKAVLSNKPHKFACAYVDKLFKDFIFEEVHGQKVDVPKKPSPIMALEIMKKLNSSKEKTLFVGDTPTDIKTAKNAKIKSIGVAWGFRPIDELEEAGADYIAHTPLDIINYIESL